jgi:hypothetical protein
MVLLYSTDCAKAKVGGFVYKLRHDMTFSSEESKRYQEARRTISMQRKIKNMEIRKKIDFSVNLSKCLVT